MSLRWLISNYRENYKESIIFATKDLAIFILFLSVSIKTNEEQI